MLLIDPTRSLKDGANLLIREDLVIPSNRPIIIIIDPLGFEAGLHNGEERRVTADEFDKRTLKFPLLGYLKSQRHGRASRYFMWASLGFSAAIWLYLLLDWYRRP